MHHILNENELEKDKFIINMLYLSIVSALIMMFRKIINIIG
jgi:hypothetical protein